MDLLARYVHWRDGRLYIGDDLFGVACVFAIAGYQFSLRRVLALPRGVVGS